MPNEDQYKETRQRVTEWVEAMWNLDVFNHEDWSGPDEIVASIMSYIEGNHIK